MGGVGLGAFAVSRALGGGDSGEGDDGGGDAGDE